VDPKLKKKFVTTTIVSTILWVILFLVLHFKLVTLPPVPASWR
jgi:predicted secreted protein